MQPREASTTRKHTRTLKQLQTLPQAACIRETSRLKRKKQEVCLPQPLFLVSRRKRRCERERREGVERKEDSQLPECQGWSKCSYTYKKSQQVGCWKLGSPRNWASSQPSGHYNTANKGDSPWARDIFDASKSYLIRFQCIYRYIFGDEAIFVAYWFHWVQHTGLLCPFSWPMLPTLRHFLKSFKQQWKNASSSKWLFCMLTALG